MLRFYSYEKRKGVLPISWEDFFGLCKGSQHFYPPFSPLRMGRHESDLHIQEHYTDTGGASDQVFALTALLGFRFAPRLRDALSHRLYLVDEVGEYGSLNTLPFGQINAKLITEQWDEMRRVASSIRHGTVSASLLMRKLAAYPRQNRVARALTEMGKLELTSQLSSLSICQPTRAGWSL